VREPSCSGTADRRKARLDRSLGAATCRIGMPKKGSNAARQAQLALAKLFMPTAEGGFSAECCKFALPEAGEKG
jgi:hypothetical protein